MKSSKGISKKSKTMDYTNYAYNEAVGRLKVMLADNSYAATPKMLGSGSTYLRNFNEDSGDNFSDNLSVGLQCLSICLHLHDLVLFRLLNDPSSRTFPSICPPARSRA